MKPLKMPHTTRVLNKPRDWDDKPLGECIGLPVTDSDGFVCSYWAVGWKDRLAILFGRPVRLSIVGYTHPPVMIDVEQL